MNYAEQSAVGSQPDFTADDIEEARRLNRKLAMLPQLRMETAVGRIMLNIALCLAETYPLLRGVVPPPRESSNQSKPWAGA